MPKADYISIEAAADVLGVSTSTVRRFFDEHRLAGIKTPKGTRRILKWSVEALRQQMNSETGIEFPPKE